MMTNRAAAKRYARALLEVSQKDTDPEVVGQDLLGVVTVIASYPKLDQVFASPGIPAARKKALVSELFLRLGDLAPVTKRLLVLLSERDRLSLIREISEVYQDELMELRNIVRARVTTAWELELASVTSIKKALEEATGKQVEVDVNVDTTLLGGIVTQIGSTVYDGSVAGHLGRLRQRLSTET
tara:strand:+ start:51079 stop:51630 length:552 start_codon:yes stop_codon:yes gene_type:complete